MTDALALLEIHSQFLVDAADAMDAMAARAAATATSYRVNHLAEASQSLAALMGELRQFGALVTALREQLGIDPHRLDQGGVSLDEQISQLGGWLELLIAAHAHEDWLALADVLELDLEPMLRGWGPLLRGLLTTGAARSPGLVP
jgi:hypothetical protein